jgi:YcaO-like protein with predicted kinase domain
MKDDILQAFFGKSLSRWNISRDADPRFYSEVCGFIETLKSHGITGNEVSVDDFGIFSHSTIRQAIEDFTRRNPGNPLPLENINVVRHVAAKSYLDDLKQIHESLEETKEQIVLFSRDFSIKISLNIYVGGFDAGLAAGICEVMGDGPVGTTTFIFSFPDGGTGGITGLRSALADFLGNPLSDSPEVLLAGFPLCFAPAGKFKVLCRYSLGELKSLIRSQRETIKETTEQARNFLPACLQCRCRAFCYAFTAIESHPEYETAVMPAAGDTVAFVGGSLPRNEYIDDRQIVYTSPAEQGDMLAAILAGFRNILIIDGLFYSKFPCTTFEVMMALERGLNVFGSSSIGALRAVELDNFGMTGLGYVYDYLKKQHVTPYHIVAQTYNDDNSALTIPLVDIIYFLDCAVAENIIPKNVADFCLAVADKISFPMLSFEYFIRRLKNSKSVEQSATRRLEDLLAQKGRSFFSIKKKDAIRLLSTYRDTISARKPDHVLKTFQRARDKYLDVLYGKYRREPDLSLPCGWRDTKPAEFGGTAVQRDRRDLSPAQTCTLAEEFFRGLDVILSDTSGYDPPAGSYIINTFFIPFYFLGYPLSSATGNGDVYEEALASAYMELVERIPTHNFTINTTQVTKDSQSHFPLSQVPQYYNLCASTETKQKIVDDHGYVKVTDILSGEDMLIPAFAVMSVFSGSDGNASGNSYAEAVLYGIYEVVERDTNQLYLRDPECKKLGMRLRIDPAAITEERCRTLMDQLAEKGYEIAMYHLVNMFDLPCIRCRVFDKNRNIECHGSTAVRADFHSAVYAALHEAYMQHISYFAGIRDDYRSFLSLKEAQVAYRNARSTLFGQQADFLKDQIPQKRFPSLRDELGHVIDRLATANIRYILVANTSPIDKYILKSVKVIVPGTELWFVPEYQPSEFIAERIERTRKLIQRYLD